MLTHHTRTRQRLPELILRPGGPPAGRRARMLTPVYGSLRRSFSGTTWFCAHAAMAAAALDGAFTLNTEAHFNPRLQITGALWKLQRRLRRQKYGGFKFVGAFHNVLWSQHMHNVAGAVVVNNTQIYGDVFLAQHRRHDIVPAFYIDGTLTEYFETYGQVENHTIGQDMVRKAIDMEREGYHRAARIITMSQATATALETAYAIPRDRIAVVIPGANIEDTGLAEPSAHTGWADTEFTLGFIGLFPLRKGLDKLALAVALLRRKRVPVRLRVIGRCPDQIAAQDGVDFLGAISKFDAPEAFITALRTVDLGCQISRAELLGIAMLEFIRLGVPVMATAVGGMPDVLQDGAGVLVSPDITAERLADEIETLIADRIRYEALRQRATERAPWASWRRAAAELDASLAGIG